MTSKPRKSKYDDFSIQLMGMLMHWQYINHVDDDMMADFLNVELRTYRGYIKNPDNIKLNQVDSFLDRNNMSFNEWIESCSNFKKI